MDETRVFRRYDDFADLGIASYVYDYAGAGFFEDAAVPGRRTGHRPPTAAPRKRSRVAEQPEVVEEVMDRPIRRRGQGVSLLTVIGFAVAALLLLTVLMAHVQLTKLSDAAAARQAQVTELTEQQHKLQARYEQLFSLAEVERYATEELGMQKLDSSKIIYLEQLASEDVAVVIRPENDRDGAAVISSLFSELRSYFS